MDSIGTSITKALAALRDIDDHAAGLTSKVQQLEQANSCLHSLLGERVGQLQEQREVVKLRDVRISELERANEELSDELRELRAEVREPQPSERDVAWAIDQDFADRVRRALNSGWTMPNPQRAADAAYLIRMLGNNERPIRMASHDVGAILAAAEIVAAACAAL